MLAALPLPSGSSESSTNPAEGGSALASPGFGPPATPDVMDEHAWWIVPVAPAETVAYIYEHLPPCTTRPTYIPEKMISGFTWPGNPGTLVVWAVGLANGSTALRVDAQVGWIIPRPASERIPSGARLLKISGHEAGGKRFKRIKSERAAVLGRLPSHLTSTVQIEKIVALLNGLRVHQPGERRCPIAPAGSVQLTFYTNPSAPPLAIANIHTEGCGGVSLTINGIAQPGLEGGWYLVEEISRILEIRPASEKPKPHR